MMSWCKSLWRDFHYPGPELKSYHQENSTFLPTLVNWFENCYNLLAAFYDLSSWEDITVEVHLRVESLEGCIVFMH